MNLISIVKATQQAYVTNKFSEVDSKALLSMAFKKALPSLLQGADLNLQTQVQAWVDSDGIEAFLQRPLSFDGPILVAEVNGKWAYMDQHVGDFVDTRIVKGEMFYALDMRLKPYAHPSLRMLNRLPGVKQALISPERHNGSCGNFYKLVPNFLRYGNLRRAKLQAQEIH